MSVYTSIIILCIMLVGTLLIYRDLASPALLMLIPWIASFLLLIDSDLYFVPSSNSYTYIVIGLFLFQFAYCIIYMITNKEKYISERPNYLKSYSKIVINKSAMIVIILVESAIMFFYYRRTSGDISEVGGIYEYIHKMVFAVFYLLFIHYYTCEGTEKKRCLKYIIIQCIPLIPALMLVSNGRASYYSFLITVLTIYLIFQKDKVIHIFKAFIVIIAIMTALFIYVALRKHHIITGTSSLDILIQTRRWISQYLSGPIIAFSKWFPYCNSDFSFGKNTFRIVYAILNRIGFQVDVPPTIFSFVRIGGGINEITNVYTFFYTYIIDFGKIGTLFIETILGLFYARMYIKTNNWEIGNVFSYSVFMYALMMQFFADQYVAIVSYYLQMYIWYFVFYRCRIMFYTNYALKKIAKNRIWW